jgi:hypothetical protein
VNNSLSGYGDRSSFGLDENSRICKDRSLSGMRQVPEDKEPKMMDISAFLPLRSRKPVAAPPISQVPLDAKAPFTDISVNVSNSQVTKAAVVSKAYTTTGAMTRRTTIAGNEMRPAANVKLEEDKNYQPKSQTREPVTRRAQNSENVGSKPSEGGSKKSKNKENSNSLIAAKKDGH